ncbi:hypothetical protein GCM10009416_40520 [Craurococcus roseus]|uniref:Uncharacterized protein n=1 Tax=Craurococcus roseus TaxID=77585 RepID=A0ABN1FUR1_9PROT
MLDDTSGASRRPSPFSWLHALGLHPSDLAGFGAEVRLAGRELRALHRDAAGRSTGWERVVAGPHGRTDGRTDGRLRYAHTEGGAKALFRSPPGRTYRLLVTDGALPAIAAAACDRRWSATCYAGVGGV